MKYRFGLDALTLWIGSTTGVDAEAFMDEDKEGPFLDTTTPQFVRAVIEASRDREAASGESQEDAPA